MMKTIEFHSEKVQYGDRNLWSEFETYCPGIHIKAILQL